MIEHSQAHPCHYKSACSKCHNNLVSERLRTVFMLTPKAASQSIVRMYRDYVSPVMPFMSRQFVIERCDNYLKVATVRNPWARLVSCWKDKTINQYHRTWPMYGIQPGIDFDTFARVVMDIPTHEADKHFRPQTYDLTDNGVDLCDILIHVEQFGDDWPAVVALVQEHSGVKLPPVGVHHVSGHRHYSTYYSPELAERVGEYYHDDILHFGYEFEPCN